MTQNALDCIDFYIIIVKGLQTFQIFRFFYVPVFNTYYSTNEVAYIMQIFPFIDILDNNQQTTNNNKSNIFMNIEGENNNKTKMQIIDKVQKQVCFSHNSIIAGDESQFVCNTNSNYNY